MIFYYFTSTVLVLLNFASGIPIGSNNYVDDEPVVTTRNGKISGKYVVTEDKFPYAAFLGIPYAEPPLGKKRFQAPYPKQKWEGTIKAVNDTPMCIQLGGIIDNSSSIYMSEDCLHLNVYSPDLKGRYPVMVFLHGGAFIYGSDDKSHYGPDYLVQEEVVIVSVNYRLGIFGFLSTGDDASPGNYGLKDQIMALKWIQENISPFGGDPNRVTIFGESAGSASVSLLLLAEPAKGLFHGAMMESGVGLSSFSRTRDPLHVAKTTASILGIATNNTKEMVDEMKKIEAYRLLSASMTDVLIDVLFNDAANDFAFAPSIEPPSEEAVLTNNAYEQFKNGNFSPVPLLVGFNSNEGSWFAIGLKFVPLLLSKYNQHNYLLVPAGMNSNVSLNKEIGTEIKQYYFGNESITKQLEGLSKYITDDEFIRPTNEFVRHVSKYVATYYYEFLYCRVPSSELPGVGHGDELPYLWAREKPLPKEDEFMRKKMLKLWTNFAKYRNPTPESDAELDNVIWKPYTSTKASFLEINSTLRMGNDPRRKDLKFWSSLYEKYGNPPYDTY